MSFHSDHDRDKVKNGRCDNDNTDSDRELSRQTQSRSCFLFWHTIEEFVP